MKKLSVIAVAALVTMSAVSNTYALAGVGFHWGFDYSMGMEDVPREAIKLGDAGFTVGGFTLSSDSLFYVSRMDWKSSPINFGGKLYVDIIPFIETIEFSCNFGLWQYNGSLHVLDPEATAGTITTENPTPTYKYGEPIPLTLKNTGLGYIGLTGTPYAKLQLDATIRKTILNLWLIKFSAGAGVSAHFATPLLSSKIVESALNTDINESTIADLADPSSAVAKDAAKKIVQEIIDEALGKPAMGAHILLGVKAKLPVVPIGIYVDGKYMLPLSKFDKDAGDGINGFGLLVNAGISLSL